MRRTWQQIRNGKGHIEHGRPRMTQDEKNSPVKSLASMNCYEWLKQWGEYAGEVDSSPKDYDLVLDPFDKAEVYEEYRSSFRLTHLACSDVHPCSYRHFKRILNHWMSTDRVRVRAKKNITTKCDGETLQINQQFLQIAHRKQFVVCEELKYRHRLCKTRDEYEAIKRESANHRNYVMKLRQIYQAACEKARHDDYFAVVAFDGSDQLSTHVPMHWRKSERGEYNDSEIVGQKLQLCLVLNGVPDKLRFYCFNPLVSLK